VRNKNKTCKSEALAAIHETVSDMYDAEVIDKQTMRRFDSSCLTPVHEFTGEESRASRAVSGNAGKNVPPGHR